jgi:hypothetical protein
MKALAVFAVLFLVGCATTAKYEAKVQSWEGKDSKSLVQSWGQPDATEKLPGGNRVFLYSRLKHEPAAFGAPQREVAGVGTRPASHAPTYIRCATFFEVDPGNRITSVMFRGDDCKSKE